MKITVLGAGAWGTALAIHAARQHPVVLWTRNQEHLAAMRVAGANPLYLGDYAFPEQLQLEGNLQAALSGADMVLSVVPTAGFRHVLREIKASGCKAPVVWACKGLESASAKLMHEVAQEELPSDQLRGVLSGPSFAVELAKGLPTAVTLASSNADFSQEAAAVLHTGNLRVYSSSDVVGVAVGGALKNVMAIAAGICDGMQFGNNARAALITRGLAEITRFGLALGGHQETFMGLTGAGDLILTCTGDYSCNREVGLRLARGETLAQILAGLGHVAEGVHTAREVFKRASSLGVEMPITHEVDQVLSHGRPARAAVENLLRREQKSEVY
ncbi:MAG: NAD(P)-dependent glycerol-3-phosphate dehydrogenase [Nitrosomonadales bacterium]|nr:MAG: NAD(P)-dependent glycerol-3-phosphate dehydrogenase [Nitrosomonadales bacterium]